MVPAVVLALETLKQALDRGAHAATGIALDEGQQLLLRLGQAGGVVGQQAVLSHAQVFAEVGFGKHHVVAQHAQVGVGGLHQLLEALEHAGLAVFAANVHV